MDRNKEQTLRQRLGIPADAERIILFAETSHWDPNWLQTSEEYYRRFVRKQLDQALAGLRREPRRIYSVECMFFLRQYWEREPHQQDTIRELVNERRLRLTSSGVTTADTLLPSSEAILRGFLLGQEWLRSNGMTQEPKLAYFSDSFGASPALPSLLRAAGFEQTAITRVDGMHFPGLSRKHPRTHRRPGSTAERLVKEERTLDFVWRDRTGAEVLCHWNAFGYGQGDLLAHRGFSRLYLYPFSIMDRSPRNIARRIRQYTEQLLPYSRTPYLFCPIGFDFVLPIPGLVSLLDRYNEEQYPTTGTWAVNGGLDDYLDLVNLYRQKLPVIELDPNPYWSGFYSARPALKGRCHRLVAELRLVEELSHLPHNAEAAEELSADLEGVWWAAATSNHHDFITGTSPDRIVDGEQIPWLEEALRRSSAKIEQLGPKTMSPYPPDGGSLPEWSNGNGTLTVRTPHYSVVLDEEAGGSIVRAEDPRTGALLLGSMSNDLISYKDAGGLWRMGFEFGGGSWKRRNRSSQRAARFQVGERSGGLEVSWTSTVDGEEMQRAMWFHVDSPAIHFRLTGRAPKRRTVTVSFSSGIGGDGILMDAPGGVVFRPNEKVYTPTFWPFQRFLHVRDTATGRGLALYQNLPGAVSFSSGGELELVALRNAPRERAYHFLPVSGNPAWGFERDAHTLEYALEFTPGGDWIENEVPAKAYAGAWSPWTDPALRRMRQLAGGQVVLDRSDVWVMANKPARRGKGRILRLYSPAGGHEPVALSSPSFEILEAHLCDSRERDIRALEVRDGSVHLTMPGTIASVRLVIAAPASN